MDYEVRDQNGEQIRDVNDMVLDFDNSTIAYVVVGAGGFLGLGEKDILIPWKMIQLQTSDQTAFVFSGNQDAYKNFPYIELSTLLPGTGQPAGNWDATIKRYWQNGGTGSANGQATNTPECGADMTATPGATATPGTQKMQGVILASDLLGSTIQTFNSDAQGSNGQSQGNGTVTPAAAQATASSAGNDTGSAGTGIDTSKPLGTMDMTVDDVIVDPNSTLRLPGAEASSKTGIAPTGADGSPASNT